MGIKMPSAYNSTLNQRFTARRAEVEDISPPWKCIFCSVLLEHVDEGKRTHPDGQSVIIEPAFFRLAKKHVHADNCRYNLPGYVHEIYGQSKSDVLGALASGQFEFRLHLLDGPLQKFRGTSSRTDGTGVVSPLPGPVLDPYLRVLSQILQLRAAIEKADELARVIKINYNGRKIPWNKFFFEPGEYLRAHEYLSKTGAPTHPITVRGLVKRVQPPAKTTFDPEMYVAGEVHQVHNRKVVVSPRARLRTQISGHLPGEDVLIFGRWSAEAPEADKKDPSTYFHRLRVDVYRPGQILAVTSVP